MSILPSPRDEPRTNSVAAAPRALASVLVIDDEAIVGSTLRALLKAEGFDAVTAASGEEGVELLRGRQFEVAIADLRMPGMNGIQTISALKKVDPNIEVIILTGYATVDSTIAALREGACDFLLKPLDLTLLRSALTKALEMRRPKAALLLYEASRTLLAAVNRQDLIPCILAVAQRALRASAASLALVPPEGTGLTVTSSGGPLTEAAVKSIAQIAMRVGEALRDPSLEAGPSHRGEGGIPAGSVLTYPLEMRNALLGALVLWRDHGMAQFSASDVERGNLLADEIVIALDNARLYRELARKVEDVEAARRDAARMEARNRAVMGTAQEAVARAEARARAVMDTAQEAIVLLDKEGIVWDLNPKAVEMLGRPREQAVGRILAGFAFPARFRDDFRRHLERAGGEGRDPLNGCLEIYALGEDGKEFPIEISTAAIETSQGKMLSTFARDITERKRALEALRASEEKFRQLTENIHEVFFVGEPHPPRLTYISPTYEEIWGRPCQALYERADAWINPILSEDRENGLNLFTQAYQGKQSEAEFRVVRPDGSFRNIHGQTFPLFDGEGRFYRWVGIAEDITERKRAEEGLRESEDRYRDLVENNLLLIGTHDSQGRFLSLNRAGARLLEAANTEEVVGRQLADYVPSNLRPQLEGYLKTILREGHAEGLMVVATPSGKRKIVEYRNTLRRLDAHEPIIRWTCQEVTERIQAQRAQAFLASLVESSQDAIIGKTLEGIVVSWNRGAEELYGYRAEEVVGKCVSILAPPDRAEELTTLLAAVKLGEQISGHETVRVRKDGRLVDVSLTVSPVLDSTRRITGAVTIGRDITERKRAEETLRLAQFSMEHASDSIFWIDSCSRIVYVNEAACRSLECSREGLLALSIADIDPDFPPEAWESVWSKIKALGSMTFESRHQSKQGRVFPVEVTANYLKFGGKEYSFAFAHDITQRKEAEQQTRLHTAALESAANGITIVSREGRILWVNPAFTRLTGYTASEVIGKNPRVLKADVQDPAFYQKLWQTVLSGEVWQGELVNRRKDGTVYTEEMTITPVRDGSMAITHFIAIKQDITERKRAEQELSYQAALLEAEAETTLDGILVVDPGGRILQVNKRFVELWNVPGEIVNTHDDKLLLEYVLNALEDPGAFLERVNYLYAHESERSREEVELKSGKIFDRFSSPLHDGKGKYYGRIWYFRDITKRKRAERALQERTVYLNTLFEISPVGIAVLDTRGKIQMSNSMFERLFQYSRQEIVGANLDDTIVPPKLAGEARTLTALCLSGGGARTTSRRRRKDGTLLDTEIYGVPLVIDGQLRGYLALYQDITERKRAEADLVKYAEDLEVSKIAQEERARELALVIEELARERDLLGTLMDNLPDHIYYKDRESRFLRTNLAHAKMLGLTDPRQAVDKTDYDFFPAEDAKGYLGDEQRVIETGQPLIGRIERIRQCDGQYRWYFTSKVPIRDTPGRVTGLVGISRDITEQMQAEETLRASEERYRELFENASDIVYTTGMDTHVTSLNRMGQQILGYTAEEAVHLDLRQLVSPKHWNTIERSRERLSAGESDLTFEVECATKDGRPMMLEVKPRLIYRGGKPVGVQGIARDVTGRDAAELELRHAQKLESVGRLASGIAHEINTPIQFVGDNTRFLQDSFGGLQTLLGKYQELRDAAESGTVSPELLEEVHQTEEKSDSAYLVEEIPKALVQTLDGVTRVATIVRAMKEFAHPEGKEMAAADLNRALLSTLTVARNEVKYVADVETEFGDLPLVVCNIGDLNQVFLNLLVNAAHAIAQVVKGTGEKGKIRIATMSEGSSVLLTISDTGCGIPESNRPKVFDPFFTTKEVGRGTGQGLAIARSVVVDRHKGTLTFASEVGKGTTFLIRLPVDPGPSVKEVSEP